MFDWILTLSSSDKIELFSAIASLTTSIIAIVISVITLKKSSNAIIESSRANIMLYFDISTKANSYIVLKNFGNSIGKITKVEISPKLDYSKSPNLLNPTMSVIQFNNTVLSPNQIIKSWFPFINYPDKIFKIDIYYKTLNRDFEEHYSLDINYVDNLDYLYMKSVDVQNEKDALVNINNSLIRFTEKF